MTAKQIKMMEQYLIKSGIDKTDVLCMTISELIDKYYELKGVQL